MKAKIGFEFPLDGADQWDGFNDPGMEHFSGNPFQHLGREVPQNTIDAKTSTPARIVITLKKIKPSDIPDVGNLKSVMERCRAAAEADADEKPRKFFTEAISLLEARNINVLQFADYNTSGVAGPCENGRPFFAMMKATGQSKKAETSTGSYGIGKFAPYTVSALRTVFLTTVWQDDNGDTHHYVQGKAVLMSHVDATSKTRRGTGFWGIRDNCAPLTQLVPAIPNWLRRDLGSLGTTLSIVGFIPNKGWDDVLAANIAENFFGAIYRGELEVEIEGSHLIDKDTLSQILSDDDIRKAISNQENEPEKFENVGSYLRALSETEEVFVAKTENFHLGDCELRILVGEKLPKKVAVLRNGMLITEGLPGLKRFSDFKEFAAVLECKSSKGQALLRAMEPPRHDAFEPDRLPRDKQKHGRVALKEIAEWVREMLRRYAQDQIGEQTTLDEMADFFADEAEEGANKIKDENPGGKIIVRAKPLKPQKLVAVASAADMGLLMVNGSQGSAGEEEGDDEGDELSQSPGDSDDGGGEGPGEGGTGEGKPNDADGGDAASAGGGSGNGSGGKHPAAMAVPLSNVRAVPIDGNGTKRRVAFTPSHSGDIRIHLEDSGADTNYPLSVVHSSLGTVKDGAIEAVQVKANQRCLIEVTLSEAFSGTLKVVANAV